MLGWYYLVVTAVSEEIQKPVNWPKTEDKGKQGLRAHLPNREESAINYVLTS